MTTNKAASDLEFSDELQVVVTKLIRSASSSDGSITEDDIQVAIAEMDVDDDELTDIYEAIRARGVSILSLIHI